MHTTPNPELLAVREQLKLERLRYRLTMNRVQTKALETLERLMDDPEPTGNEKADRFEATERNRQRLAANQTLIHCRTAQREKRLAKVGGMAMQRKSSDHPNSSGATGRSPASDVPNETTQPDHPAAATDPHWPTSGQWHTTAAPKRSRYKTRKPKHPRRSRKQKNRR